MSERRKSLNTLTADVGPVPEIPVRPAAADPETPQDGAGQPARGRARSAASNGKAPAPKRSQARSAPERPSPPAEPELTDAMLGRWRWQLAATARKLAATEARANAALADWERLVADAADVGVPGRLVVAAAADAGIEPPALP